MPSRRDIALRMRRVLLSLGLVAGCARNAVQSPAPIEAPVLLAPGVLSGGNAWKGSFAPSGRELFYFRRVAERGENYRIFVSRETNGVWSQPERVTIDGDFSDLYPTLSPDGQRMVFASY